MSDGDRFQPWGTPGNGNPAAAVPASAFRSGGPFLPFGAGRSYGDSCTVTGGKLLDGRYGAAIRSVDHEHGVITADAGVTLSALIEAAAPGGMLPVVPGTQFATLGGAIANDVHGKNHHRRGSFGAWVNEITLRRSDQQQPLTLRKGDPLFAATIGGMGMTGRIERAKVRLTKVPGQRVRERAVRLKNLDDYFARAEDADRDHEYAVAWVDSLATGAKLGRGHLIVGDHVPGGESGTSRRGALLRVPFTPPVSLLNGISLRAFNEFYLRSVSRGGRDRVVPHDGFFFPLDRVLEWNRLYGPRGLHQHQSVLPWEAAREGVRTLLELAQAHGHASFLTVIKTFGENHSPAIMSFARPGVTLTLDFPARGAATLRLLDELDSVVMDAGGAVNPYKDRRMSAETFARSFPRWRDVEVMRDPAIRSDFWRRTALALSHDHAWEDAA
ncbi:MAG: FAD-binding oxidoreductase [Pseudomonadota bacterium]